MTQIKAITLATYQPGKAPILLDASPTGLVAFTRAAKLFFRIKNIKEDEDKVKYISIGVQEFPELYNWYLSSATAHEAKKYDTFITDLQRWALPRDDVWEAKGQICQSCQGNVDYKDWADEMRTSTLP